jgi:thiol-disulfide isomerase/thioredoxin
MMRCLIDPALLEDPATFMTEFIRTMQNQPVGLARDIIVYALFAEFSTAFPDLLDTFASQAQALLDSDYARQRFALLTAPTDVSAIEPVPVEDVSFITSDFQAEPLPKADMLRYLAEKHQGKVIYIDIAAHWCGPCIQEIPYMKKLEEAMAGEDVVFVTLWLESDFDATVALMRKHDLRGEHYFFPTDAARLFSGNYGVSGFPTYMLVDRSGKLVINNAGRPSAEGTAGQIRELLQ